MVEVGASSSSVGGGADIAIQGSFKTGGSMFGFFKDKPRQRWSINFYYQHELRYVLNDSYVIRLLHAHPRLSHTPNAGWRLIFSDARSGKTIEFAPGDFDRKGYPTEQLSAKITAIDANALWDDPTTSESVLYDARRWKKVPSESAALKAMIEGNVSAQIEAATRDAEEDFYSVMARIFD